jgi:hypothetical protein
VNCEVVIWEMLECVFGNAVQVAFQKCFLVENLSK